MALLAAGCGDDGRFHTFPATGMVRFSDGTPLPGGAILCESPHGLAARATIQPDGTFRLWTYEPDDGAVEGKHKVAIRPPYPEDFDPDGGGSPPQAIDDRFLTMESSGIEFDVTAAGPNQFAIEVTRPGGR